MNFNKNNILYIFIHCFLPFITSFNALFITLHAYGVIFYGCYLCLSEKNANKLLILIFYIVGSELLWRSFQAKIFWESGKIFSIFFLLVVFLRMKKEKLEGKTGILFICLLLPSIIVLDEFSLSNISHSISGPFLIGTSILVFSHVRINQDLFLKMLYWMLLPIISFFIISNYHTILSGSFNYYSAYINRIETAGIGPNQASNILGLGSLLSFFIAILLRNNYGSIFKVIGILTIIQTILTHSRGGFWNTVFAILIFYTIQLSSKNSKIKLLTRATSLILLFYFLIFPFLDGISRGSVYERFTNFDIRSRENIIESELFAFSENPLLGIGPGSGRDFRNKNYDNYRHSHTEYTRLIAEHGSFGILAIFVLLLNLFRALNKTSKLERSISTALLIWGLLFLSHSATRLAAPCIFIGFSNSRIKFNKTMDFQLKF